MANKINISIPQPCHENWQEMSNVDRGKFCTSCQKNVIDFTHLSDREIIKSFEKNNNLCGRFLDTQLNRDLVKPKEKSTIWLAATAGFISLIGFGNQEVKAQEHVKSEQTDKKTIDENLNTTNSNQERTIIGTVSDGIDPNEINTIPGITILVKGTKISTQTDFDGNFTIKAKENDILVFSAIGWKTIEVQILKDYNLDVKMEDESYKIESVIVGGAHYKKQTFFRRTFHSIGNWFK